jgi:hypothetical protein
VQANWPTGGAAVVAGIDVEVLVDVDVEVLLVLVVGTTVVVVVVEVVGAVVVVEVVLVDVDTTVLVSGDDSVVGEGELLGASHPLPTRTSVMIVAILVHGSATRDRDATPAVCQHPSSGRSFLGVVRPRCDRRIASVDRTSTTRDVRRI